MRVVELFQSLQGEAEHSGQVTTFIRLSGCNASCKYCDSKYANDGSCVQEMSIGEIMTQVRELKNNLVEITGGEPLLQLDDVNALMLLLDREGYSIDLETNGSIDIRKIVSEENPRLRICKVILDIKTPGSGMDKKMFYGNLRRLNRHDNLKFVVTSKSDMEWAKNIIKKYGPYCENIYFSPCIGYGDITLKDVAEFIIKHKNLGIKYSHQIHKIIWPPDQRGV